MRNRNGGPVIRALRFAGEIILILVLVTMPVATAGADKADLPNIDEVDAMAKQAAPLLAKVRQGLLIYDRVLQMQVAIGALPPQQVAAALSKRAEELAKGTVSEAAQEDEQNQEAKRYFDAIEKAADGQPHWPSLQRPAFYKALVRTIIERTRAEYAQHVAAHKNPSQPLSDAYVALALTRGEEHLSATPFMNPDSRVFAVMDIPNPPVLLAAAPPSRLELRVSRRGQDFRDFNVDSDDPLVCEKACEQDTKCQAFTFSFATSGKSHCWLKSAVPAPRADPCCVSEVMARSAAPTATKPAGR